MVWIKMRECPPQKEQEILFIAHKGKCSERIGIAVPDINCVLLKRTDISFCEIKYWLPIPPNPDPPEEDD